MFFNTFQNFTIRFGLFLIYIIISIFYLAKDTFSESKISTRNEISKKMINWLWIVNISSLIIVIASLDLTYNCIFNQPSVGLAKTHSFLLVSEISFFIIAFALLLFPNILYGMPISSTNKKTKLNKINKKNNVPEIIKELAVEDPLNEIISKINNYIEEKKPYVNPNFSLDTISIDLKITVSQASECLTIIYRKKFSEIKKQLRVEYAKQLLENNTTELITIDAIGQKCGFSTRSNFYSAFKSITNSTPSQYLSLLKEKK
jgi:AraC-like DNA-binding protein